MRQRECAWEKDTSRTSSREMTLSKAIQGGRDRRSLNLQNKIFRRFLSPLAQPYGTTPAMRAETAQITPLWPRFRSFMGACSVENFRNFPQRNMLWCVTATRLQELLSSQQTLPKWFEKLILGNPGKGQSLITLQSQFWVIWAIPFPESVWECHAPH